MKTMNSLITDTFFEKAMHTVVCIDDQFCSYDKILDCSNGKEFEALREACSEIDRAKAFYTHFHKRKMLCDIVSDVDILLSDITQLDKVKKSDLLIIDYQLNGEESGDRGKCIRVLNELKNTDFFNLVVVYTNEDIEETWIKIASHLKGGWKTGEAHFPDNEDVWDAVSEATERYTLSIDDIKDILNDNTKAIIRRHSAELGRILTSYAQERTHTRALACAISHKYLSRYRIEEDKLHEIFHQAHKVEFKCDYDSELNWIKCGNLFVAICEKQDNPLESGDKINNFIKTVLQKWNPNPLQLLLSEIQNTIEAEGSIHGFHQLRDSITQTAWMYSFVRQYSMDPTGDTLNKIVEGAISMLFESLKDHVLQNGKVQRFANEIVTASHIALPKMDYKEIKTNPELFEKARKLSYFPEIKDQDIVHELNRILCTDSLVHNHITTGTVFQNSNDEYLICIFPECDMFPRPVGNTQPWLKELDQHYYKPFFAIKITETSINKACKEAEHCNHIFWQNEGGKRLAGYVASIEEGMFDYQMLFLENRGLLQSGSKKFKAKKIEINESGINLSNAHEYTVIFKIKGPYASRFLQGMGQQLSRIGVDYASFGE